MQVGVVEEGGGEVVGGAGAPLAEGVEKDLLELAVARLGVVGAAEEGDQGAQQFVAAGAVQAEEEARASIGTMVAYSPTRSALPRAANSAISSSQRAST